MGLGVGVRLELGARLGLGLGLGLGVATGQHHEHARDGLDRAAQRAERQLTSHGAAREDVEQELDLLCDGQHEPVQGERLKRVSSRPAWDPAC